MTEESGIFRGVVISGDTKETLKGKGNNLFNTNVETRKHGYQTRLETSVVHAVKHKC